MLPLTLGLAIVLAVMAAVGMPVEGQSPRRGGMLSSVLIEDPPGLLIHAAAMHRDQVVRPDLLEARQRLALTAGTLLTPDIRMAAFTEFTVPR